MRKLLKNHSEVAHFWANQVQGQGKSSNMFFEDGIIYSYGYHFPIARHIWGLEGKEWGDEMTHETFLAKYSPEAQGSLSSHIDSSNYSITLALNNDFTGGGTWYNRQKTLVKAPVGHVCLFPMPTHRHSGRWIDSGKRYIVVSFCKKGW